LKRDYKQALVDPLTLGEDAMPIINAVTFGKLSRSLLF
jgi:hypothetical protein